MPGSLDTAHHYDRVTEAWTLVLGEELHYGVFASCGDDLATATAALTALMIDASRLRPGLTLLDVGCGTGAQACRLAADLGVRVSGITTSSVGVAAARHRAAAAGLEDRVVFHLRDGTDNGFAAASFDRVWALESSHLMRDRPRLLRECARVLRPGGLLALCDIVLRRPVPLEEVRARQEPLLLLREVFGDARMDPLERYAELAGFAGLVVESQLDLTAQTRPTFGRWRENAQRYQHEVIRRLGEAEWRQLLDACEVMESLWDDGTLGYGLMVAAKPADATP